MKAWLQSLPLANKLILGFLIAGLVPMLIVGAMSLNSANQTIERQVSNQLQAVRDLKANEIRRYFETVRNQAVSLALDPVVLDAARQLPAAFQDYPAEAGLTPPDIARMRDDLAVYYRDEFGAEYGRQNAGQPIDMSAALAQLDDASVVLQHSYIRTNPNPLGSKHLLDSAPGDTRFNRLHQILHGMVRPYVEKFGFYDVFIVDAATGRVVYSTFKELDFATSLKDGAYAGSSIGEAYRKGLLLQQGNTVLVDFQRYRPSYDAPASFVATPIVQGRKTIALLMFQIPISRINSIMADRSGMGSTGETYLVGPDYLMRSDSYLEPKYHSVISSFRNPGKGSVKTESSQQALGGTSAVATLLDYNGNPVVSAYTAVDLTDFKWALLAEQDVAEAFAPVRALLQTTLITAALCVLGLGAMGWWFARLIATPINRVASVMQSVSNSGSFQARAQVSSGDEVGRMAASFNDLLGRLGTAFSQINHALESVGQGNFNVSVRNEFNGDIAALAQGVNSTIGKINEFQRQQQLAAERLRQSAEEVEKRAAESAELARVARVEAEKANRVRQALDVANTCVMMADADNNIIYTNHALDQMMRDVESDIRKALPQFSASALIGTNMDHFHRSPQHQRNLIANLTGHYQTQIRVGERTFRLNANPILLDGQRIGTVVEWNDRTAELRVEAEIDQLVEAAARGDFSSRLDLAGRTGFFLSLGRSLNSMIEVTHNALADVTAVMERLAQGDLTRKVQKAYSGQFGKLKDDVNNTIDRLQDVISRIKDSSGTVATGAREIAQGMSDLSSRTEAQAASLEETAASMDQMTASVKSSSASTQTAADLSRQAETRASEGGKVVQDAVASMQSISDASKRIADIIGVIDEIAFQTNLLALNAAVEAARAGEQGRGFAVVAGEVRNLAQRSGQAAREIKNLIKDSLSKVEAGRILVNQSGETLASIVQAVEEVGRIIQNIAHTSVEQSSGISQVNIAITSMDDMTQQNSALVEEVTAAGTSMAEQARTMSEDLAFFTVNQ